MMYALFRFGSISVALIAESILFQFVFCVPVRALNQYLIFCAYSIFHYWYFVKAPLSSVSNIKSLLEMICSEEHLIKLVVPFCCGSQRQVEMSTLRRTELGWDGAPSPAEGQPHHTVISAPTRGDTLDKLNSDKSACQYDLNRGCYFLSTLCHIAAPVGLLLSAVWLFKKQWVMKEWEQSVTDLTCWRKRTYFD